MAPSSSSSAATTSVQVALRIRPPTTQDSTSIPARFQRSVIHASSSTSVSIETSSNTTSGSGTSTAASAASSGSVAKKQFFSFDQVHPPPTTQYDLFTSTAKPLVTRFVEGFNCTILAYGQTSSGKTFTMTGIDLDADPSDPNNGMGIIPRAVSTIFSSAKQLKEERGGAWNYSLKGSFIEIYNEDLIDLLCLDDSTGGRREVQIREDKDGHIIWGGLREVNVRNASEVMSLLRKGTSIRRTNETDMNAQSSRSHAIFSLTLTQKKYTGSSPPPRSSSPLPPGGRSPSRLARPGSMYASPAAAGTRVASPTFGGRPSTPSFVSAMGRGGGLRPASALGHAGERSNGGGEDDGGEWVTIVSKFHFVDLAGSERLKRTAAAGERIKEGISINSGLLALGNVISALGDPSRAKSHTATHVPYRDSKLTRLLQDSLGGNAHTLMIACVSPAEWNAAETINTLKYANRARNIKNRAILNEREDGWDDVEWLQGTVTRLRKELKTIKDGGIVVGPDTSPEILEGAGKKVLAQMSELQNNYEDLREKFVERTEELTRLRRELGERQRGSGSGAIGGTAKYEEIVGPVIEEYEKTISAMEAELKLNRAALRHTNEMVEEKEEELAVITERHAATELYVEELRGRVVKLTEREASTEAYVKDLEEKIKSYDETSVTSTESMSDLKREVLKYKDAESYSGKYIADLEARLARSDESILGLQQTVEKLEADCDRRREEVLTLQSRLETLRQDGESWRTDLEERERKVKELEGKMLEWEKKKKDASEARVRLGSVVGEVASARRSLEIDLEASPSPSPVTETGDPLSASLPVAEPIHDPTLENQLFALQQTHTATLADLSSVTAKYRDALREISDLAAQIQEAKLSNPSIAESSRAESPVMEKPIDIPPYRRRMTGSRVRDASDPQFNASGRRLFFRQAASAESLHARSLSQSQSLSQELSSVHSRKTSFSSHGTSSSHSPSNSHSHSTSTLSHMLNSRPNLSISLPSPFPGTPNERSVGSLEKEIMRLQEVLKEREAEITILEESLKESQEEKIATTPPVLEPPPKTNGQVPHNHTTLSPKTLNQFDHLRKSMENGNLNGNGHANYQESVEINGSSVYSDADESLERFNELMLSMAQKESYHREVVDELNAELTQVRRQLDDLTALSRDQAINMSTEIEGLRGKHDEDLSMLNEVKNREASLITSLADVKATHATEIEELRKRHQDALDVKSSEVEGLVLRLKEEHESSLQVLRNELAVASALLEKSHHDHEELFGKLKAEHDAELRNRLQEANDLLSQAQEDHEKGLSKVVAEHNEILKQKDAEATAVLQTTEEEYYNALTKLRGDHAEALKKHTSEMNATLDRLHEEHAGALRIAEIAREGSLSETQSSQLITLKALQEEHATAISRKEASFAGEMENLRAEHARSLTATVGDYTLQLDRLRLEHETTLTKLKEEWRQEAERLNSAIAGAKEEKAAASVKVKSDAEAAIRVVQENQASVLREFEHGHEEDLAKLNATHELALKEALTRAEEEHTSLVQCHRDDMAQLQSQNEQVIAEITATLTSLKEEHQQILESAQENSGRLLDEEKARSAASLIDLTRKHTEALNSLQNDHDLLLQELDSHKVAADEFALVREQTRQKHERALGQQTDVIKSMEQQVADISGERNNLEVEVAKLRGELDRTRGEQSKLIQEASKRESLVGELERHRSVLAETQENLQKVKDEKDNIQIEKNRADALVRDLQAQLARSASPPNNRAVPDRNMSYTRATGLPAIKLPPPTPPPSVPPPPAPRTPAQANSEPGFSNSSQASSAVNSSTSSRESQPDSPSTSVGQPSLSSPAPPPADPKIIVKLEQQAKQLDEQEAMIKTLNKQLTHCETDLQTHMDLVNKLETSLGDSEKNLRKARMHATELARERDTLNSKIESLRNELSEAKREVVTVRRSIVEEKQSLEQKLEEERKAKDRARQQLDSRMDEIQKRKSKFACL
ncbi:kinesin [Collybia nuda]|uniref:Kinesin n=1 Tax=Collybia nuda TaxID=64659 RepID=A0A9P5YH81_9AGAR|nr:kinesin [Collybia nuda]